MKESIVCLACRLSCSKRLWRRAGCYSTFVAEQQSSGDRGDNLHLVGQWSAYVDFSVVQRVPVCVAWLYNWRRMQIVENTTGMRVQSPAMPSHSLSCCTFLLLQVLFPVNTRYFFFTPLAFNSCWRLHPVQQEKTRSWTPARYAVTKQAEQYQSCS